MSRTPLIAANWKLHLGPEASVELAAALAEGLEGVSGVDLAIFPTTLSVAAVASHLKSTSLRVGLQWAGPHVSGAHTGANSAALARAAGCAWLLVGHSEVRRELREGDEHVAASVRAGLDAGLLPLVCVGETLAQREAGIVNEVLHAQLQGAFADLPSDRVATCTLAYEPVWAIGTGRTATVEQAEQAHSTIRDWLTTHHPAYVADEVRVLYGGSVNAANAAALLSAPNIDGLLVGGASLDAATFLRIVEAASQLKA